MTLSAINSKISYFITGKTQKRLILKVSESDEDILSRKKRSHIVSSDSDLESYDVSSEYSKESASRRPHKKGISQKMILSLPKIMPQEHKGIV